MAPSAVNSRNEKTLWKKQYSVATSVVFKKKPKFKIGQEVRVSVGKTKGPFAKGYTGKWKNEIFKIGEVKSNQQKPMYLLIDPIDNKTIKGGFYEKQLQSV
jgi:hypothetical protein